MGVVQIEIVIKIIVNLYSYTNSETFNYAVSID